MPCVRGLCWQVGKTIHVSLLARLVTYKQSYALNVHPFEGAASTSHFDSAEHNEIVIALVDPGFDSGFDSDFRSVYVCVDGVQSVTASERGCRQKEDHNSQRRHAYVYGSIFDGSFSMNFGLS